MRMFRRTSQEQHQAEVLRRFQDAAKQDKDAVELLARANLVEAETKQKLQEARRALRRVAEGAI